MTDNRDNFPKHVVEAIGKRASFICSNPDCRAQTLAPAESSEQYQYIGKAAHICAAAKGGPRFDPEMSSKERRAITNAIFLCSSCADLIDKNNGAGYSVAQLHHWKESHESWVEGNLNKRSVQQGRGGEGGSGTILGNRGIIIGGRGGDGGISGHGGKGGGGSIEGDDGMIVGGDGGNCPTPDGRGGRGARSPIERFGCPTEMWGFGRGGSTRNNPEYDRRLHLLRTIRNEYMEKFPDEVPFIEAGVDPVPVDWINQRLVELSEDWQVRMGVSGYLLPSLAEEEGNAKE